MDINLVFRIMNTKREPSVEKKISTEFALERAMKRRRLGEELGKDLWKNSVSGGLLPCLLRWDKVGHHCFAKQIGRQQALGEDEIVKSLQVHLWP